MTSGPFKTPVLARRLRDNRVESPRGTAAIGSESMCSARCDHVGFPVLTRRYRLGSPLDGTPWPVIQDGFGNASPPRSYCTLARGSFAWHRSFSAANDYYHVVSCTFHVPSGMLFTVRSCYYCAIGLGEYLGLGVGITRIRTAKPSRRTRGLDPRCHCFLPTGLSPSMAWHSRNVRLGQGRRWGRPAHHISTALVGRGFGLACSRFARRY